MAKFDSVPTSIQEWIQNQRAFFSHHRPAPCWSWPPSSILANFGSTPQLDMDSAWRHTSDTRPHRKLQNWRILTGTKAMMKHIPSLQSYDEHSKLKLNHESTTSTKLVQIMCSDVDNATAPRTTTNQLSIVAQVAAPKSSLQLLQWWGILG